MNNFISAYRKIIYALFYVTAIFISAWLSFFISPFQSHHGNMIVYFQSYVGKFMAYFLLVMSVFLILPEKDRIKSVFSGKADLFLWAYFGAIILRLFFIRGEKTNSLDGIYYILSIAASYYFFKNGGRFLKNTNKLPFFICILGDIVALFAIIEIAMHKNILYEYFAQNMWYKIYLSEHRAMATQIVPAVLGTYLLACIPMAYFLIYNNKNRRYFKAFGILSAILCIGGLVVTFSRGSLLGFIFMTIVYFYRKSKKAVIYLILGVLAMILIFTVFKGTPGTKRFGLDDTKGLKHAYSNKASRLITTYNILNAYPVLGLGLFNYREHFNDFSFKKERNNLVKIPDNMHFMILGENGALGYLFFVLFIVFLLKKGYGSGNEISLALSVSITGILVNMCTYDLLYWTTPFFIFWIYCGMLASIAVEPGERHA